MTAENFKLVICEVKEGSLVSQQTPFLPGIEWVAIPGSYVEMESYWQQSFAARVPASQTRGLPDNCYVERRRFRNVTKLNVTWSFGEEVLEVCYQDCEGGWIQTEVV